MRPDHAHPSFSPDGRRLLIQSGLLNGGKALDLMVIEIPEALRAR
jgi:oligogalacturonide lyase